jgi:hypothetical protein
MLSAALLAVLLRVNLPVAAVCTWYTNPFTIVPLYYAAYKLGLFVTGDMPEAVPMPEIDIGLFNPEQWFPLLKAWMAAMGKPFLLGLLLLASILAVSGYFAVLGGWRLAVSSAWRQRLKLRRERRQSGPRP